MKKPLSFGEILDQTFRIVKTNFGSLFMISFLVMAPILIIQSIMLALSGRDLFSSIDPNESFFDQILNDPYVQGYELGYAAGDLFQESLILLSSLLVIFATPLIAGATVWGGVKHARDGESFMAKDMLKKASKRYWPLLGGTFLLGLIIFGIMFAFFMFVFLTLLVMIPLQPIAGIPILILLIIGFILGAGLLFTRWSLYLPATLFERVAPGLAKSWRLTKRQTWKFFGMFIVLAIIIGIFSSIFELLLGWLGDSVLYQLLYNFLTMITSIIFTVGYSVMYFDARVRQEATDLKDMIDEYDVTERP